MADHNGAEKDRMQFGQLVETPLEDEITPNDLRKGTDQDDLDMQRIGKRQQLSVRSPCPYYRESTADRVAEKLPYEFRARISHVCQ